MMEHLGDDLLVQFMNEARRVLKPNGRFLTWTLSRRSPMVLMYRTPRWVTKRLPAYGQTMVGRTADELCRLADASGFRDSKKAKLGRFFPFYSAVLASR